MVPVLTCTADYAQNFRDSVSWITAVDTLLNSVLDDALFTSMQGADIETISFSSTSSSFVITDASLNVLHSSMYDDTASSITSRLPRTVSSVPNPLSNPTSTSPTGGLTRLAALYPHLSRNVRLHTQGSYISSVLTGGHCASDTNNLLKLGWNPVIGDYDVQNPDIRRLLPEAVDPGVALGVICPRYASKFGAKGAHLEKTRIVSGSTDSICAFIAASPSSSPGTAVTSLGSTTALKVVSSVEVNKGVVYSHRIPSRILGSSTDENVWLVGGASMQGLRVLRDLKYTPDEIRTLCKEVTLGTTKGDWNALPMGSVGDRFPRQDESMIPSFGNYNVETDFDRAAVLNGVLGAISEVEARGYNDVIRGAGGPAVTSVTTTGGGANNDKWAELRAKRMGVPVRNSPSADAALGAALIGLRANK